LKNHLRAAIRRKIVVRNGAELCLETRTLAAYDREELLGFLMSVMKRGREYERDEVTEALSRYLGFQRTTDATREVMATVFNSAIRRHMLAYRGQWIWREG
jgi:hypothetical protein